MPSNFPKINISKQKGQSGQTFVEHFITDKFKWIYHGIPIEKDYGIDAYLEIVENEIVTGKQIGIQIKHGNSYFNSTTQGGFKYEGEDKHLNYYLNISQPVILLIIDDEFKRIKWVLFEIEKITPKNKGWWIEIPEHKNLTIKTRDEWMKLITPVVDYTSIVKRNSQLDKVIQDSSFGMISIPRTEIENMDFSYIESLFKRLSKNKKIMIKARSSLDFYFPEYDLDTREIYDIPEIRAWIKKSIELDIPWFYFLAYDGKNASLNILLNVLAKEIDRKEIDNGFLIKYDQQSILHFIDLMFYNLNQFTEKNNIEIEINKEISLGLHNFYSKTFGWKNEKNNI